MVKKNKPNILFIMSDQHRHDCLGVSGNEDIKTPNIDELAADGVYYQDSFSVAPSCTPSRYSILTGLYPRQHQGFTNQSTIPSGTETFPKMLQRNGYQTKIVGKLHATPTYLDVGFDDMTLAEQTPPGRYEDDYHLDLKKHHLINEVDLIDQVEEYRQQASSKYWESFGAVESNIPEEYDSTTWIGEKAMNELHQWEGDGNLLKVSFIKPHHPFNPPKPWSELYNPEELQLLPGWTEKCLQQNTKFYEGYFPNENLSEKQMKQIMAYYYANITHIDAEIGRMIDLLKSKNMYEDCLIIFTSDHGEYLGFHHMLLKGNHLYDPLARVPLIIKYPNQTHQKKVSTRLTSGIDLAPTILKEALNDTDEFMSGYNLNGKNEREYVFAENGRAREYMVRSKKFKLLLSEKDENSLFFDLINDPLEFENLYQHPNYQKNVMDHKEMLYKEVLFKAPSPVHLDQDAKQVKNPHDKNIIKAWNKEKISTSKYIK